MPDAKPLIPDVTDKDIEWVRIFMRLDPFDAHRRKFLKCCTTIDLSACPGSGKTMLIVAKLAILAKKWPYRTKGICVLSHTNVAREQIEHRLGRTAFGQRLLTYPHFIGTIHGFVNRYLALPWLSSSGYPVDVIDDKIALRRRWFNLPNKTRAVLKKIGYNQELLRISDSDFSLFSIHWGKGYLTKKTRIYNDLVTSCKDSILNGFHCYDEMFVWADALLKNHEDAPSWLAHRFPLIVLDEMQDTSERQAAFLEKAFPRASDTIVVQRVGDPNQAIYDEPQENITKSDFFPEHDRCIDIPNSYRFGGKIAAFASPFAVSPVGDGGLAGIGPKLEDTPAQTDKHAVFMFPDDDTKGVLEAYGNHALSVLGPVLAGKGLITAIGHVHLDDPDVSPGDLKYPKSVGHYWDGYSADLNRNDPHPDSLAKYVRVAQELAAERGVLSPGVDKLASGILRLARHVGDIGDLRHKTSVHRAIVDKLQKCAKSAAAYSDIVKCLLADQRAISENEWGALSKRIKSIVVALCDGDIDMNKAEANLGWPRNDPSLQPQDGMPTCDVTLNTYRVKGEKGSLDIRLGSIHSAKGQTHLATLLLNTFWYHHSAKQMMPWLTGEKANGNDAGVQNIQRLLLTYVAMTRPSHLVCIALPRTALGTDQNIQTERIALLRQRGWCVANIAGGNVKWCE